MPELEAVGRIMHKGKVVEPGETFELADENVDALLEEGSAKHPGDEDPKPRRRRPASSD